jgi:hypothetical protein
MISRVLVSFALLVSLVCPVPAQEHLSFHGRVVWISGNTLVLAPDQGGSLNVDLTNVPQGSYESLNNGDSVTVSGVASEDRSKLIADSVTPDQ